MSAGPGTVTSSSPECKKLVALSYNRKFNDMSPEICQLKPHCPFPNINYFSNSNSTS